ncbi:MAG: NUDIX hydrolase [bacterium]
MPKKLTDEEYHKSLPKKQIGTAVLFFNSKREILIVKPDYKESWLVVGGSNDENESPLQCAIRETKEEIGLEISQMKLIGVYHSPKNGIHSDALKFIFDGGELTDEQISQIKLQAGELTEYKFENPEKAIQLFSNSLKNSIPQCLNAIKENTCVYIDGV